jgi:hypothetical protein
VLVARVMGRISGSETEAVSALGRHASSTPHSEEQCLSNFSTPEEHCLLACDAVYTERYLTTCRKIYCLYLQGGTSNRLHGVTNPENSSHVLRDKVRPRNFHTRIVGFFFSFLGWGWDWVRLVRRPLTGLLYQPRMIDDECGAIGGMRIGRGNQSTRKKPAAVSLCLPQIPLNLTRAAAVGSQRLTAWDMARPSHESIVQYLAAHHTACSQIS